MAKGDRGSRGRGEYGGGDHDRGTSRRDSRGNFGGRDRGGSSERRREERERNQKKERERRQARERKARDKAARDKAARDKAERDRAKLENARRRETAEEERERYESAGEASDPDRGHSGWGDTSYGSEKEARRGEQRRRDREKKERARNKMRQREEFRRSMAADRASGGLGGTTEYGRNITDAEIDSQMEKDAYDRAANDAWNKGSYGDWLGNRVASAGLGVVNDFRTEGLDFMDAPLDYAADVARDPFLSAAVTMVAPGVGLGLAGLKVADSITDYVQDELTGEQALRQGAGDIAGTLRNQGLAAMASFVNNPQGTVAKGIGSGLQSSLMNTGPLGMAMAVAAPSLLEGALNKVKSDPNLSPKERRALKDAAKENLASRGRGGDSVNTGGYFSGDVGGGSGGNTVSSSGGQRSLYSPNNNWQVSNMDLYGMDNLPSTTPSTTSVTGGKMGTDKQKKALTLIESYPWLFDQGVLSSSKNPYAVTT